MPSFIRDLHNKPHHIRKQIFVFCMVVCFIFIFSFYVFSLRRTVAYAVNEQNKHKGIPGEFSLPTIKDSLSAGFLDILGFIKEK